MKQANIKEKICKLIEEYGTFNGNIMGYDTYVIFAEDFAKRMAKAMEAW